jgi:hypothetical protein
MEDGLYLSVAILDSRAGRHRKDIKEVIQIKNLIIFIHNYGASIVYINIL